MQRAACSCRHRISGALCAPACRRRGASDTDLTFERPRFRHGRCGTPIIPPDNWSLPVTAFNSPFPGWIDRNSGRVDDVQRAVAHRRTPRLICRGTAADGAPDTSRADQIEARLFRRQVPARGCQARYSGYRGVPSAHIIRVCVGTVRAVEQRHILLDCCNGRRGAMLLSIDIRGRRGSG